MSKAATYTVILMLTTTFAKVLGLARELTLSYVYGASAVADAYIVAFSVPTVFFAGIGTAILTCYITIYTGLKINNPGELKRFSNSVTTLVFLVSLSILTVFLVFDRQIVRMTAVGFTGETFDIAVTMSAIMMVSILFIGVYFILQGFLQIHGSFFAVGMVSVPLNLAAIASIFASAKLGNYKLMGWGAVLGYAASFLMLYIAAKRRNYTFRPCFQFRSPYIKKLLLLMLPIFVGKEITQLNNMIDKTIASFLPEGNVSVLHYASQLTGIINSVFALSVAAALFPQLTRLNACNNHKKLKTTFITGMGIMSLLVMPISAGVMIFSKEIVQMLFLRGAFTPADVDNAARVLFFYSFGLMTFSIKDLTLNVFYAIEDTKTPTINSLLALILNTAINLVLLKPLGAGGLALATSLSATITLFILFFSLRRRIGPLGLRAFAVSLVKMLLATLGMVAVIIPVHSLLLGLTASVVLSLVLSVGCGAVVYGGLNILLRTREMGLVVVGVCKRLHIK
ncbi:MAG: murein biosynthesis integral membrane protein MurJ [Angelakisella sp.]